MNVSEYIAIAAALAWFGALGYAVGLGPHLAPGEPVPVHNPSRGAVYWLTGAAIPKPEEVFGAGSEQYDGRSAHLKLTVDSWK